MSIFEYKAIDANGKENKGLIESDSQKTARNLLQSQNLTVVEIIQSTQRINQTKSWIQKPLNKTDISLFMRQLASLIQAAMPAGIFAIVIVKTYDADTKTAMRAIMATMII